MSEEDHKPNGEAEAPQHDADREAVEAEARRQGWRPKEEFSGAGTWVDAPEFVERGKQFQSILKRENRELRDTIKEMETRQQARDKETSDVIKQFREQQAQREQRAYERGKQDIQAQMDNAAASGDTEGYNRGKRQMQEFEREHQPPEPQRDEVRPAPAPAAEPAKVDPYVAQWGRENPWFNTDPEANAYAQAMHVHVGNAEPHLTLQENLAEVRRRVVKRFPELFNNSRRDDPSPVGRPNGGGRQQPKKEKGYDDLPADAKSACDKFVKQGLFKDRAEYCKNYDWEVAA